MPEITIDNKICNFNYGQTILEIAEENNIKIPSLCYLKGIDKYASCMVCVVKDNITGKFIPSCTARAENGMSIDASGEEAVNARKDSLEFILSNHTGDCIAPCMRACPMNLNIPLIMENIKDNDLESAYNLIVKEMPMPLTLTGLCGAFCEKVCRRGIIDESLSICSIKKHLLKSEKYLIIKEKINGKKIALVGAGLNGLTISYFLLLEGFDCTLFEKEKYAGGRLLNDDYKNKIDNSVFQNEIDYIKKLGAKFVFNKELNNDKSINEIKPDYDAIIIASDIDYESNDKNIFKEYFNDLNPLLIAKHCKKSVKKIIDFFNGCNNIEINKFNSVILDIKNDQFKKVLNEKLKSQIDVENTDSLNNKILDESKKCLHCECHKADNCELRIIAGEYKAKQLRYKIDNMISYSGIINLGNGITYEQGKCIKCGICVRLSEKNEVKNGFTFYGRGFDLSIKLPFNGNLDEKELSIMKDIINKCPAGALNFLK